MEKNNNARILLVDPEPEKSVGLQRELKQSGFDLILARTGDEAMFLTKQKRPSLILAELNLPQFSGPNLLRAIRATESLRATPFIFLSEQPKVEERIRILHLKPDDYIRKPFHIEEVIARIKMLLQEKPEKSDQNGDLSKFSLLDLLQLMRLQSVTGILKLKRGHSSGEILLKNGEFLAAKCGDHSALTALKKMTTWTSGTYQLHASELPDTNQTRPDLSGFWQTAPIRLKKWRQLMRNFPALSAIPALNRTNTSEIAPPALAILKWVDNHRSFAEILEETGPDETATVTLMALMIDKKILLVRQNPSVTRDDENQATKTATLYKKNYRSGDFSENEVGILSRFFQSLDKESLSETPAPDTQSTWNGTAVKSRHIQLTKGELMMIREHLRSYNGNKAL